MNDSCHVMQDLFVPYLDDTCSEESRTLLEQHLGHCESCRTAMQAYQTPVPSVDIQANAEAGKPFKKIRRRIRTLMILIAVLLILILPAAVYQMYGRAHDFYKADQTFLGLDDSDFLDAARANGMEERARSMYRTMYYTLQSRNGTADPNADLSELVAESNALNQIACDYENAEIAYDETFNSVTVTIPLILQADAVPTVFQLVGTRTGCGEYSFSEFMLYPENIREEKYVALDYAGAVFDTFDIWPFTGHLNWTVAAWETYEVPAAAEYEPQAYMDTGRKIPSGVYVCTEDDGQKYSFTVYDDGTLMYEVKSSAADNSGFPDYYPSALGYLHATAKPCAYFIVEGEDGLGAYDLVIRYEKTGIRNTHTIEFSDDGSFCWRNCTFVKAGSAE